MSNSLLNPVNAALKQKIRRICFIVTKNSSTKTKEKEAAGQKYSGETS
jgi:hypothetical protein